jgi:Mannosyltransferase (PIG-V)
MSSPDASPPDSVSALEALREIAPVFLIHRLGLLSVIGFSGFLDGHMNRPVQTLPNPGLWGWMQLSVDRLCLWDCGWYSSLSQNGYATPEHAAFFPLFPLLGRSVSWLLPLSPERALILVSNLAALVAAAAIFWVLASISDRTQARWATTLFLFWPFSFFQAAGYAESCMVMGVALSFAFALRGRWVPAAFAIGFAMLARHLAVLAMPTLLWLYWRAPKANGKRVDARALVIAIPAALLGIHLAFLQARFQTPFAFFTVRQGVWAPASVVSYFTNAQAPEVSLYMATIPVLMWGVVGLWRVVALRPWALYATLYLGVIASIGLSGLGRFPAACFPLFLVLGGWAAKREQSGAALVGVFALLQGMTVYLFSHGFPIN